MPATEYSFLTHWTVPGTCPEVYDVLYDGTSLPRWWPSVYLETNVVNQGGPDGVGASMDFFTKGWLPYTLRWRSTITEVNRPDSFSLAAAGDLTGTGEWQFAQKDDNEVEILFDWRIRADKPILRSLSWLCKPVFSANHRWAMRKGEESLKLELLRRRALDEAARAAIPAPPQPTFWKAHAEDSRG
ncbi:SRPBCC family protein [Roseimicrobium sp. ORNL1]|uniref:SRPBCC family protein n=1 Tax=Roseimicrobium sp. ORNL1 TaxID=2711231 RepID=UPI0013E19C43|nr:SRPBCC family protein [Roseimicrobium sp. ORNL1]QIF02722.1 polyketide cyclase [Roseimicrobium sp. ORNL1]